jgi:peptidoglycan/xylan/chitin deacetylase (PgdA/CDA1 family)
MLRGSWLKALVLAAAAVVAIGCGAQQEGNAPSTKPQGRTVEHLSLPSNPPATSVQVPILTYHRVHAYQSEYKKSVPDETVEPSAFAKQMDALTQNGYQTVTQTQLYHAMFDGKPLPPKPVLITVDDGYKDDVTDILPVLKSHHMVATFYIITDRLHEQGFVDPGDVRMLDQAGMDIGAHTRTHADLARLGPQQLRDQVEGSRDALVSILGHPVYYFAYPFGTFSPSAVTELRNAGFVQAVTTHSGTQEFARDSLTMPRIHVGRSSTDQTVLTCTNPQKATACGGKE